MKTLKLPGDYVVYFEEVQYEEKVPGIRAIDVSDGIPYAVISFNAHDGKNVFIPSPGCIWLKDWSEMEALAAWLLDKKMVTLTGRTIPAGYVTYKEVKVEDIFLEIIQDRRLL